MCICVNVIHFQDKEQALIYQKQQEKRVLYRVLLHTSSNLKALTDEQT